MGDHIMDRYAGDAQHNIITLICHALSHSRRHFWGYLAEKGICNHDSDGTDNEVRFAAAYNHSIFSGSRMVCPCFEHIGCGSGICADSRYSKRGVRFFNGRYDLLPNAASLGINN